MNVWRAAERLFDRAFGQAANPLRQLGALGFHLFWIVLASGVYVYIFFDTSVEGAYRSVERLGIDQPYVGGLARSLHRYASDAFVLVVVLHLVRELALGRFRGFRWFSWLSGVPTLWLMLASGIIGYWMVWDGLAQFTAIAATEWFAALPGFGPALVRNFVDPQAVSDRFFSFVVFLHIGVPLALLVAMWIHIQRITRARVAPDRRTGAATLVVLVVLSLVLPAGLAAPADLSRVPQSIALDWWYLGAFPAMYATSPAIVWIAAAALTILLALAPWIAAPARAPAAVVDPVNCNGCTRCFVDCPYGAVVMVPRADLYATGRTGGAPRGKIARVIADACAGCGICTGACPSSTPFRSADRLVTGIDLPHAPIDALRARFDREFGPGGRGASEASPRIAVFTCREGAGGRLRGEADAFALPCAGMLPPAFVEYALRNGADGVLIAACPTDDCAYRFGARWLEERISLAREPHLRAQVPRERVRLVGLAREDAGRLAGAVASFRRDLMEMSHG